MTSNFVFQEKKLFVDISLRREFDFEKPRGEMTKKLQPTADGDPMSVDETFLELFPSAD